MRAARMGGLLSYGQVAGFCSGRGRASASKGILVTTSGYGQASSNFAQNKPIELIDGSNLLYLLAEHAGIEARIMPPRHLERPGRRHTRPKQPMTKGG